MSKNKNTTDGRRTALPLPIRAVEREGNDVCFLGSDGLWEGYTAADEATAIRLIEAATKLIGQRVYVFTTLDARSRSGSYITDVVACKRSN